jgi:hypothetical protein
MVNNLLEGIPEETGKTGSFQQEQEKIRFLPPVIMGWKASLMIAWKHSVISS